MPLKLVALFVLLLWNDNFDVGITRDHSERHSMNKRMPYP
jgi:hypothetical protein